MYLSYHAYSKFILHGWCYDSINHSNKDQLHVMGNVAAQAMQGVNGDTYMVGTCVDIIGYESAGVLIFGLTNRK